MNGPFITNSVMNGPFIASPRRYSPERFSNEWRRL